MISKKLPPALRWIQLLAACLTGLLIPLCFTGPAVVLPAISDTLGGSVSELSWVMNAYILSYGSAMMVSGSLTDIYGRRRIWLIGLAWFCGFTFAIPFAPSVLWIDVLRLLQGLGGAAAFAAAMSSLAPLFEGQSRARVFSLLGTTFGLGLSFGPLLSGWIVEDSGWHDVFYVTGMIGVCGGFLVFVSTKNERMTRMGKLDGYGAISFTVSLGLFTWGMLRLPEQGWRDAMVITALLTSVVMFLGFIIIERRMARPMLDLRFFRDRRFVGVQLLAASPAFLFIVLIVMLPGRFIGIDGFSAFQAGQMMVWLGAPLLVVPFMAAILTRWFTPGQLSSMGLLVVEVGLVWLAHCFSTGNHAEISGPLLAIGIGMGLPWGLMDGLAVSVVTPERVGMATGIFNTVRVSADGVAIAVVSALLAGLIQSHLTSGAGELLSASTILDVSSRAALGELHNTSSLMAGQESLLRQSYARAFISVLYVLAGLAVLTAIVILILLRGLGRPPSPPISARSHPTGRGRFCRLLRWVWPSLPGKVREKAMRNLDMPIDYSFMKVPAWRR